MTSTRPMHILDVALIAGCEAGMVAIPLYIGKMLLSGNGGFVGLAGTAMVSLLNADLMEEERIENRINTFTKALFLWLSRSAWVIPSAYAGNAIIDYLFPSSKDTLWVGHIDFWVSATALAFTLYIRMHGESDARRQTQPNF